jgi:rubrerythrin
MYLVCSSRCGSARFRALFAEVDVNAEGEFQDFQVVQPGYVCLHCGAPALDVGEVPAALDADRAEDELPLRLEVLCPVCETLVEVLPEGECPNCGAPLTVA